MFQGFPEETIRFFLDLRFHNEVPWFHAHREEYEAYIRKPFREFIEAMAPTALAIADDIDTRPNKCLARINRDIRFTRDKSPYRDHHWVAFRRAAIPKDGMPFYWFEIRLESINWGLGVWGENRNLFDALRRRMEADPREMEYILSVAHEAGFAVDGDRWKKMKAPSGLPLSVASVYNFRTIYFEKQNIDPAWIFEPSIVDRVARDFTAMKPVWKLLRGLSDIGEETV